jgi:hypothetical protein
MDTVFGDRIKLVALSILMVVALVGCGPYEMRTYSIPSQSTIPVWLSIPQGMARTDVLVEVRYDRWLTSRTATFLMRNARTGIVFESVTGKMRGMTPRGGPDPDIRAPYYEVVTVGDQSEVLEHHGMNDTIFVSRDPAIRKWFGLR